MNIKDLVKDNFVEFQHFRNGELWYRIELGDGEVFDFPVPVDDVGSAVMMKKDKALLFMRYIRKHLKVVDNGAESV
jgi:hypothetical protein